jgi:acyl-CoA hydrolase
MDVATERSVAESSTVMTQLVMPNDTNPHGTIFGGRVLDWIDICGAICAARHSRCQVVTAAIDEMSFLSPIRLGHFVLLTATIHSVAQDADGQKVSVPRLRLETEDERRRAEASAKRRDQKRQNRASD